jgi:hypothetical protein
MAWCSVKNQGTIIIIIIIIIMREEVGVGWRRLHSEELHNLYSSQNIVRVIKSGRMRWAGYVARLG